MLKVMGENGLTFAKSKFSPGKYAGKIRDILFSLKEKKLKELSNTRYFLLKSLSFLSTKVVNYEKQIKNLQEQSNKKALETEKFKKDLPSGIVKDPADILIDGTKAVMFLSKNAMIGDTREVWFIKNGFLFEVVTYRDLDAWLSSIMQTWQWLNF